MNSQLKNSLFCAKGCGFFGSSATLNLCSKCYNDHMKEVITKSLNQIRSISSSPDDQNLSTNPFPWVSKNTAVDHDSSVNPSNDTVSVLKNRCQCCRKKIGLIGFKCRCGDLFCGMHRYPEEHSCTFNYKDVGCEDLEKENPVCKADKLQFRI